MMNASYANESLHRMKDSNATNILSINSTKNEDEKYYARCVTQTPTNVLRDTIVGSILLTFSILGTFSNFFICMIAKKYRFYKTTQELLILLLAISDLLISVMLMPLDGIFVLHHSHSN